MPMHVRLERFGDKVLLGPLSVMEKRRVEKIAGAGSASAELAVDDAEKLLSAASGVGLREFRSGRTVSLTLPYATYLGYLPGAVADKLREADGEVQR